MAREKTLVALLRVCVSNYIQLINDKNVSLYKHRQKMNVLVALCVSNRNDDVDQQSRAIVARIG